MTTRKYFSEFALNMMASVRVLIQQDGLESEQLANVFSEEPCHIYVIGRRPRMSLNPDSLKIVNDRIVGDFRVQLGNDFESVPFSLPVPTDTPNATLSCPYPHTHLTIQGTDGSSKYIKVALLPMLFPEIKIDPKHLDVEVLYVGQSYGVEGARTAPERLRSHSTLQGIYAEAIQHSPDKEVWLLLMSFHPPMMFASFDGISKSYGTTMEEDDAHIQRVLANEISEQQQINFTEAALIRYFQPPYNSIYKDRFPNPAHQTYSQCYDLEINAVSVEVQTDDMGFMLWSEAVPRQWVHLAKFPLYSREDRLSIFEIPIRR